MDGYGGRRNKAEQDAAVVEFGYALLTAAFAGAVVFGAFVGPALLFDAPPAVSAVLLGVGAAVAFVVFVARVVAVLVRFRRAAQPSQPGRTSPDS
ncbi:DUF6332 family protein [Streptomyces sp. NPDC006739]|uniref:DUF6332 family protein n=1 Tax=Streptomyces sp. NPDC006739 TaxID=3364763 RepID=UPI0036A0A5A1